MMGFVGEYPASNLKTPTKGLSMFVVLL